MISIPQQPTAAYSGSQSYFTNSHDSSRVQKPPKGLGCGTRFGVCLPCGRSVRLKWSVPDKGPLVGPLGAPLAFGAGPVRSCRSPDLLPRMRARGGCCSCCSQPPPPPRPPGLCFGGRGSQATPTPGPWLGAGANPQVSPLSTTGRWAWCQWVGPSPIFKATP